jgi:UPF0716 family protein affecting phage T7 exclusion
MHQTWKTVLTVFRILVGILLVLVGAIGLATPVLPGWVFIIPGLLLLAKDVPPVRRLLCRFLDSRLIHRLEKRFPRTHDPLQHLRDSLEARRRPPRGKKDLPTSVEPPRERRDVA